MYEALKILSFFCFTFAVRAVDLHPRTRAKNRRTNAMESDRYTRKTARDGKSGTKSDRKETALIGKKERTHAYKKGDKEDRTK